MIVLFSIKGHVALDRNPGPGYNTVLLRLIPGDLLSACRHRQLHTLPGLLDSWAALSNSYPNALRAIQGGSLYHFYDGLWYDRPGGELTTNLHCQTHTLMQSDHDLTKKSSHDLPHTKQTLKFDDVVVAFTQKLGRCTVTSEPQNSGSLQFIF